MLLVLLTDNGLVVLLTCVFVVIAGLPQESKAVFARTYQLALHRFELAHSVGT